MIHSRVNYIEIEPDLTSVCDVVEISAREKKQLAKIETGCTNNWVQIVAAVISAYAAYRSDKKRRQSEEEARRAQQTGAKSQMDVLQEHYEQLRKDYEPFRQTGLAADEQLNRLLQGDLSGFRESPGYQYAVGQGEKALGRQASAQGFLNTGQQKQALQRHGQGMASQDYYNYLNSLMAASGRGLTATGQMGQAGQAYSQNVSNVLGNLATGQSNLALLGGQNRASTYQQYGDIAAKAWGDYSGGKGWGNG